MAGAKRSLEIHAANESMNSEFNPPGVFQACILQEAPLLRAIDAHIGIQARYSVFGLKHPMSPL